jgi:hypothetical protein
MTSDLLTWWVEPDGKAQFLALEDVPENVGKLSAAIELYPAGAAAPPADVHVTFGLFAAGSQTAVVERDVDAEAGQGALRAEGQFPIGALPAGQYTLRATVFAGDKALGSTATTIKKK